MTVVIPCHVCGTPAWSKSGYCSKHEPETMTHPSQPPPTPGREEPDWLKRAREIAADHMQPATDLAFARRTIEAYDLGFEAGQSSRPGGEGEAHASDCAVNNGPAYPAGPCDCGFAPVYPRALERAVEALERIKVATPNSTNSATAERMATWTIGVATEALASLSTIPEASGWRPIETAPKDGTPILCWGNRASWSGGYSIQASSELVTHPWEGVTHWMPLPSPPEDQP